MKKSQAIICLVFFLIFQFECLQKKKFLKNKQDSLDTTDNAHDNNYQIIQSQDNLFKVEFQILSYSQIKEKLFKLYNKYKSKNLIKVYTSQELYGLEYANYQDFQFGDCEGQQCEQFIVFLSDFEGSNEDIEQRSQVYFSGALHGNERVGPNSCIEAIELLLESYESNQWINYLFKNRLMVFTPMTNAQGYSLNKREEWISIPEKDEPIEIDPNRDFPYLISNPKQCLQSVTARTVFHLMKNHVFANIITFHAGETSITYPWGSDNHYNGQVFDRAADEVAFEKFVKVLKIVAGHVPMSEVKEYNTGNINQVVYGGKGCMEDWGYAAGWEFGNNNTVRSQEQQEVDNNILIDLLQKDRALGYLTRGVRDDIYAQWPMLTQCEVTARPSNSLKQRQQSLITTDYSTLSNIRPNLVLIETSDSKNPVTQPLGIKTNTCFLNYFVNVFDKNNMKTDQQNSCNQNNGHIARNLKIILATIDLASPYVNMYQLDITNKNNKKQVNFYWRVGGSIQVDKTYLMWEFYDDFMDKVKQMSIQPMIKKEKCKDKEYERWRLDRRWLNKKKDMDKTMEELQKLLPHKTEDMSGKGVWYFEEQSEQGQHQQQQSQLQKVTNFAVNFENTSQRKKIFLVVASTDQDFASSVSINTESVKPLDLKPVTIFSNFRINPTFYKTYHDMQSYSNNKSTFSLVSHKFIYSDFYII